MSMVVLDDNTPSSGKKSNPQISEAIVRLSRKGASFHLTQLLGKLRPEEIASVLDDLPEYKANELFAFISSHDHAAKVLRELGDSHKKFILTHCEIKQAVAILNCLPPDVRNRTLSELDEEVAKRLMNTMSEETQVAVEDILNFEEDTAGSIMDTHIFTLPESCTAAEAIQAVQGLSSHESVFYLYVVNEQKKLTGVCSMRKLIMVEPEKALQEFTHPRIVKVHVNTPQGEVANLISRYRLLAIPVVDDLGVLLGQITIDSLIHVIQDENTGSIMKMAGIKSKKTDVLTQSPLQIFRDRVPWLVTAFIAYLLVSAILDGFEATLEAVVQLAFFFPIVIGMSGNAGSQTGTVVVRGLALGTLQSSHFFKILVRELGTNIIQGVVYGVCLGVAAYLIFQNTKLSLTVGPALLLNIPAASMIAMSLPFFFKKLGADPAIAAGPLALAFIDMVGSINFLTIAYLIFDL